MPDASPELRSALGHIRMIEARIADLNQRIESPREGDVDEANLRRWIAFETPELEAWRRQARAHGAV